MISKFLFTFTNFCVIICFLTKLVTSSISFSTAVNVDFVPKPQTSGILFSNSMSFAFSIRSVTSGMFFFLILLCLCHYLVFKTNLLVSISFTFSANLS